MPKMRQPALSDQIGTELQPSIGMVTMTKPKFDFHEYNRPIVEEFRANNGIVGGDYEGLPLALITTKGRKTGKEWLTPVSYIYDGDRVVITASHAGFDTHPQWYHNLRANPTLTVEIGGDRYEATAEEVYGEERDRLFAALVASNRRIGKYQSKTSRVIPVLVLKRNSA
jgi:deazaflavin-dependent oxidoreductase (nitroreductase family)